MGIERLKELGGELAAIRDKATKESQKAFEQACEELFAKHPGLESFSWPQWTPGFNDGDPCEFSVGCVDKMTFDGTSLTEVWIAGSGEFYYDLDEDEYEDEDEDGGKPALKDEAAAAAAFKDVEEIQSFFETNEDIAETAFGNNVTVTVARGDQGVSVTVDEYDCGY